MNMDEVGFLYDCVKAGKLSKEQAKEIMYSNKPLPSNLDVQKAATFCGVSLQRNDATGGSISRYSYVTHDKLCQWLCMILACKWLTVNFPSVDGKQHSSKKAELIAKYKMLQKVNRDKSLNSDRGSKGKAGGAKSVRNPVLMKVTMLMHI